MDTEVSPIPFGKLMARLQAGAGLVLLLLIGGLDFFFPSQYRIQAGVHGISAVLSVVMGTYLTHHSHALFKGVKMDFDALRLWVLGGTALNLAGAVSGNWIYMRYRGQDGPRDWILANVPDFHNILMEYKEFVSLFPFPLMLLAAFVLFYYRRQLPLSAELQKFVGLLILLAWFFLMFGFVAGLTLTKLRYL